MNKPFVRLNINLLVNSPKCMISFLLKFFDYFFYFLLVGVDLQRLIPDSQSLLRVPQLEITGADGIEYFHYIAPIGKGILIIIDGFLVLVDFFGGFAQVIK